MSRQESALRSSTELCVQLLCCVAHPPLLTDIPKPAATQGCVTPWIVTPGEWTEAELTHHARALAEAIGNNCSANCLAAKVVILAEGWPQGDAYLAALRECLASYPPPVRA